MAAQIFNSLSVVSGSKTVTVNGGTDTSQILAGFNLVYENKVYELSDKSDTTFTLVDNWPNASATISATVQATSSPLASIIISNDNAAKALGVNFVELLNAWRTLATTSGTVTIKDSEGVEYAIQGFLNLGTAAAKNVSTLEEAKAGLAGVLPDAAQVPEIIKEQAKKGFSNEESGLLRLLLPSGATYRKSSNVVGALKIALPNSWISSMLMIRVRVFEYYAGKSFEILLSGYIYSGGYWINTTAEIIGGTEADRNFNVRFGHDGTKCCIYIGEVDSNWNYPQVAVMDAVVGYAGTSVDLWSSGWDIDVVSTFGAISVTRTKNQIGKYVDGILK